MRNRPESIDDTPFQTTSPDEFRQLLAAVACDGWEGNKGDELLGLVAQRCLRWASAVDRRCGKPIGTTEPADVLSTAWTLMDRYGPCIANAKSPWGYLFNAVRNALAVRMAADALGVSGPPRRDMSAARHLLPPLRFGVDARVLDTAAIGAANVPPRAACAGPDFWSPALRAILELVVQRGGARAFWEDALDRSVEVLADSRCSYRETALRRDPYLRDVLGLSPEQLSALGGLLIGTRRGNRADQSLLLALLRDPATNVADVTRASERLAILTGVSSPAVAAA